MSNLNGDQFLPGMEHMREAKPYQQTESQFHNRPDVMVHARFMNVADVNAPGAHAQMGNWAKPQGFHAGTERAAYERMEALGPPNVASDPHPRYFHGQVDPAKMQNTPQPSLYETDPNKAVRISNGWETGPKDKGRLQDHGEDWEPEHHNSYYRNDIEDVGSVSTIHGWRDPQRITSEFGGSRHVSIPDNFTTWRQSVTEAHEAGKVVPSHVRAVYDATGGEAGPHHVLHPDLDRHLNDAWKRPETKRIPSPSYDTPMFTQFSGSRRWNVTDEVLRNGSHVKQGDLG